MKHFATLALLAFLVSPLAAAQDVIASAPYAITQPEALVAPGDTTVLSNLPENAQLTTFSDNPNNPQSYLFGTGAFNTEIFGSGYTLPSDAPFEVIGVTVFVTEVPDDGETFDIRVYDGTLEDGPQGDPVHVETFDTDVIPDVSGTTVTATVLFFSEAAPVSGDVFFVVYDVNAITSVFAAGSTQRLDNPTPETIVFRSNTFQRVDQVFSSDGNPLQLYLFGNAVVRETEPAAIAIGSARDAGVGAQVTVEGTVSRADGDFAYIQDETGGLAIRQTDGNFNADVAIGTIREGTRLAVTGTLSEFRGLLQINGDDLDSHEVLEQGDAPDAQDVTLADISETLEGQLVTVNAITIATTDATFAPGTNYEISDSSTPASPVALRVPNADDTDVDGDDIPSNPVRITGIVSQFDTEEPLTEGYQILVIADGDVVAGTTSIGEDPDGQLAIGTVTPNPSASGAAVTVSLATAGRATLAVYDVLGREVARVLDGPMPAGDRSVRLDVADLPAGTYIARLTANGTSVVRPFTVAR